MKNNLELNSFPCHDCITKAICRQLYRYDYTYISFKQGLSDKCELFDTWWSYYDESSFNIEYRISYFLCKCFNITYRGGYEYEI